VVALAWVEWIIKNKVEVEVEVEIKVEVENTCRPKPKNKKPCMRKRTGFLFNYNSRPIPKISSVIFML
jgi:hypothetical protein